MWDARQQKQTERLKLMERVHNEAIKDMNQKQRVQQKEIKLRQQEAEIVSKIVRKQEKKRHHEMLKALDEQITKKKIMKEREIQDDRDYMDRLNSLTQRQDEEAQLQKRLKFEKNKLHQSTLLN